MGGVVPRGVVCLHKGSFALTTAYLLPPHASGKGPPTLNSPPLTSHPFQFPFPPAALTSLPFPSSLAPLLLFPSLRLVYLSLLFPYAHPNFATLPSPFPCSPYLLSLLSFPSRRRLFLLSRSIFVFSGFLFFLPLLLFNNFIFLFLFLFVCLIPCSIKSKLMNLGRCYFCSFQYHF